MRQFLSLDSGLGYHGNMQHPTVVALTYKMEGDNTVLIAQVSIEGWKWNPFVRLWLVDKDNKFPKGWTKFSKPGQKVLAHWSGRVF